MPPVLYVIYSVHLDKTHTYPPRYILYVYSINYIHKSIKYNICKYLHLHIFANTTK